MGTLTIIIIAAVAFLGGGAISYFIWDKALAKKRNRFIEEASTEA